MGISDHQLVYCTRKSKKVNYFAHKNIRFRSYKNYSAELFITELEKLIFPNYEFFSDINKADSDFSTKVLEVIERIAPFKESRFRNKTESWFDGEVAECISERDKLFHKLKKKQSSN